MRPNESPPSTISEHCCELVSFSQSDPNRPIGEFQSIVEQLAKLRGAEFFSCLVQKLTDALGVKYAMVAELAKEGVLRSVAYSVNGQQKGNFEYDILGTPCAEVFGKKIQYYKSGTWKKFPVDLHLKKKHVETYLGIPLFDSAGAPNGIVVVMDDKINSEPLSRRAIIKTVSVMAGAELERQKLIADLQAARILAESASRLKNHFLANVSHEIRTPMSVILGYSEILLDPSLPEQDRIQSIHTVKRNGNRLLRLLDDIVDISKIEAGKLEIEFAPCDLVQLIDEVCASFSPLAGAKGLQIIKIVGEDLPNIIVTDRVRLIQILGNILNNAIKFTKKGSVTLQVQRCESGANELCFHIIDTGVGMSPQVLKRVFRRFAQGPYQEESEGMGLGLAISRELSGLLGGELLAKSTLGKGSHFEVTLPIFSQRDTSSPKSPRKRDPLHHFSGINRVLLVEDSEDLRELLKVQFEKEGVKIVFAKDGQEALDYVEEHGKDLDIVLMDMQLPKKNGFQVVQELRKRAFDKPIIALTALAMTSDKKRCLRAGCDAYLSKPIDFDVLLAEMVKLVP